MTDAVIISLIGACTTALGWTFTYFQSRQNGKDIKEVHAEVKTGNALKLGQLADAAETRRVVEIAPIDRTQEEVDHIALMPEKGKGR